MKKRLLSIIASIILFFTIFLASNVASATTLKNEVCGKKPNSYYVFTNSTDSENTKSQDIRTVDANKIWTIKFNQDIVLDEATKEGITITDSKGNKVNVDIQLGKDSKTIILKVSEGEYTVGETYILSIGNKVHSKNNKNLKQTKTLNFSIKQLDKNDGIEYKLTEEGIIDAKFAKEIIEKTANQLIHAINIKDAEAISEFIHPDKGVRFTPYTNVSLEHDVVFNKQDMKSFFEDEKLYQWGYYDGIGSEINLVPSEYYKKFIYSEDFINSEKIGYNQVLSSGNMIENQFEVYENAIVVEYYFSGFNPSYAGMDWRSLRLVFQEYEGSWKLVGVINNQWTI